MLFRLAAVLLWAGLCWGVACVAAAQSTCTLPLAGRVTDHESGEGLAGATVVLLPTQEAAQADSEGHFHFHVCAGTYRVQVRFVGYETEEAELRVGAAAVRNFALHPSAIRLRSAVVRGERVAEPQTQAASTLSGQALQATRGQALGEALQKIAGVSAIQTGPSVFKPIIHGLHSNRVAIMNNGVRQEGQQWGQEHGPEIDPFVASELTVVKGAAGVRYGSDAVGGVVLVQPKPLRDSAGVGAELNLVGASNNGLGAVAATVDGNARRLPALSWRVQGTLKQAGNTRTPDYWLENTAYRERNFAAALGWRKDSYGLEAFYSQFNARTGILQAAIVGNLADLQTATERGRPVGLGSFGYTIARPYQQVRHDLAKLSGFVKTGHGGKLTATVAHQQDYRDEYDVVRSGSAAGRRNLPQLSYLNYTTTADVAWEHPHLGNFSGTVGLSGTYQHNRYAPGSRQFIPFYNNWVGGAFAIERWQHEQLTLEAGLRLDRRDLTTRRLTRGFATDSSLFFGVERRRFQFWTPSASLGAVYEVSPHFTLRADAALVRRAPAPNERYAQGVHNGLYEEGYDVTRPAGAPQLQPETAHNLNLTATLHANPRLNGELTVYQNRINGYIYQVIGEPITTIQGVFRPWRYQQTDAVFRGLDATLGYTPAAGWLISGKAALVRARNLQLDDYLVYAPADRFELAARREWAGRPGNRLSQRFAQLTLGATRRQTRVPSALYDPLPAPDGYGLLSAEVGATVRLGGVPVQLSLAGTNLLNERYREYLNRFRYFADDMGRNVTLRLQAPINFGRRASAK
ncbi:TonB-dependent receptor [Hymenobacter latericus]|uniref:TonB-dependent receptor n=1 Tax=Hymenobacter sp. YIM 151858-1 TaxID=2987688 RepID=UPI0022262AFC|nr:TonB-dependent receptor [Hymenobacter sp. YIM 151858-1]UYZ58628.1 TonB-dependent receptor [Hymenobacter sp. YIM 151858-1]